MTAREFLDAIVWGDHVKIWELLGPAARERVLAAATRRGMDAVAAARARLETWSAEEADAFLTSLVRGLRVDLSGVDLDLVEMIEEPEVLPDGALKFRLESRTLLPPALTGGKNWAAGAVVVERDHGAWAVRALEPRPPAGP